MWIQALAGALCGAGSYLLMCDALRLPSAASSSASLRMARRSSGGRGRVGLMRESAASWIAERLRLGEYRRERLQSDLRSAGIKKSPEAFAAGCIVDAVPAAGLCAASLFLFPLLCPVFAAAAAYAFFSPGRELRKAIAGKREKIEYELPRLAAHIEKTLSHSRDVLYMLDGYRDNAGPALKGELDITVADMRSGNYEAALTRLENRVGSSMLSDVSRGLIGVLRGDETSAYWTGLGLKFSEWQRQLLRREALKAPGRVRRLSMCLLFCFTAVYIVVIGTEIATSMGVLFG